MIAHGDGVFEAEHAADIGGADLPDAVPDDVGGLHTIVGEFGRKTHLYKEIRRLRDLGGGHPRVGLVAAQLVAQRPAGQPGEHLVDLAGGPGERTVRGEQIAAHTPPLRAHSAEYEGGCRPVDGGPAARHCPVDDGGEPAEQLVAVAEWNGESVVVVGPPRPQAVHQRGWVDSRVRDDG